MIYNVVIYLVLWGIAIASLFDHKVRKMWRGEREAFRLLKQKVDPTAQYVWFHAASLGEFEQGRPLMERIRRDFPQYKILLTFSSHRAMRCARTTREPTLSVICRWILH